MGFFNKQSRTQTGQFTPAEDVLPAYMTGAQLPAEYTGVNLSKAARISVVKRPTLARKWAVYFGGDISYSMADFIQSKSMDFLTEAISTVVYENGWDADNIVPAFPYGANVAQVPYLIHLGQHAGSGQALWEHGARNGVNQGGTKFTPPVEAIAAHYQGSDDWGVNPALAFVQTDGLNSDMSKLATVLTAFSSLPIHWVFVYYGDVRKDGHDNAANLRKLDTGANMPGRKVDNVSIFIAGPEPKRVTPMELYDGMLTGPAQWVTDATRAGILR